MKEIKDYLGFITILLSFIGLYLSFKSKETTIFELVILSLLFFIFIGYLVFDYFRVRLNAYIFDTEKLIRKIDIFERDQDLHKKFYKLESKVNHMYNKKGVIDPRVAMFLTSVLLFIVLLISLGYINF